MQREGYKITYLRKYTNAQRQSCTNTQIQNEKIPKNAGIVFTVCVRMVAGLQDYPNLTKTPQRRPQAPSTYVNTHPCVNTHWQRQFLCKKRTETENKKRKAFEVCHIISPLAHFLYKASWVKSLHDCKFPFWWNMEYDKRVPDEATYCLLTNFAHDIGFLCHRCF